MGMMETIAAVASILTIVGFIFAIWQSQKRKAVEQALRGIDNISKTALIEVQELYNKEADATRSANLRTLGAFITSITNTCWPFLNIRRKRLDKQSPSDHVYARMVWSKPGDAEPGNQADGQ